MRRRQRDGERDESNQIRRREGRPCRAVVKHDQGNSTNTNGLINHGARSRADRSSTVLQDWTNSKKKIWANPRTDADFHFLSRNYLGHQVITTRFIIQQKYGRYFLRSIGDYRAHRRVTEAAPVSARGTPSGHPRLATRRAPRARRFTLSAFGMRLVQRYTRLRINKIIKI